MALFKKAEMTSAYLKAGLMGFAASGKTYTATQIAIGLVKYAQERKLPYADKPVFFLDTEKGVDWVQPVIEGAGIELHTAKTRAFKNLLEAVPEAQANGSILLVDSLTHFWTELTQAYTKSKNRTRLQFEDWAYLKREWGRFTDLFINSNLHIIVCGRAGYEYDYFEDDAGKKQLEKTGIKMKAEGEMGYEPSLLVLMERHMDVATNKVWRTASVLKDRACLIDGREFKNPTFKDFLPHIERLNLGGVELGVDGDNSESMIAPDAPRDKNSIRRAIEIEDIKELLIKHIPGMGNADKTRKTELVRKHFGCRGWTELEELMPLEHLKLGLVSLKCELEPAKPVVFESEPTNADIPHMDVEPEKKERVRVKAKSEPVKEAAA